MLAACGDGAPSDVSAKVTPAATPAPPVDPAAPCCCATFHSDAVYTCEQGATSACEVFNNPKTGNRRACMTQAETERLHTDYRRVAELVADHKAKGKLHLLTEGSEMEGPWLLQQTPTIECVRTCGDGVNGPDGAPIIAYE